MLNDFITLLSSAPSKIITQILLYLMMGQFCFHIYLYKSRASNKRIEHLKNDIESLKKTVNKQFESMDEKAQQNIKVHFDNLDKRLTSLSRRMWDVAMVIKRRFNKS